MKNTQILRDIIFGFILGQPIVYLLGIFDMGVFIGLCIGATTAVIAVQLTRKKKRIKKSY